jgi:hypothetical protein
MIQGRVLDFGCGRGFDCNHLNCDGYDPYYQPDRPVGKYDTVLCHFVLNVLSTREERLAVVAEVHDFLCRNGNAFFTVRNDKKQLNGWTKNSTYQTLVTMQLPILQRTSSHVIYWMGR